MSVLWLVPVGQKLLLWSALGAAFLAAASVLLRFLQMVAFYTRNWRRLRVVPSVSGALPLLGHALVLKPDPQGKGFALARAVLLLSGSPTAPRTAAVRSGRLEPGGSAARPAGRPARSCCCCVGSQGPAGGSRCAKGRCLLAKVRLCGLPPASRLNSSLPPFAKQQKVCLSLPPLAIKVSVSMHKSLFCSLP